MYQKRKMRQENNSKKEVNNKTISTGFQDIWQKQEDK